MIYQFCNALSTRYQDHVCALATAALYHYTAFLIEEAMSNFSVRNEHPQLLK